ncbi:MAG: hypothetical protein ACLUCE_01090 [Streptococcus sp.]|uniref:hypothetical protein n=1 Tax=Streptococcus sp. TaxID=1306 RepID=UPI002913B98D|nr:hypothetical protein [Streptococcus sp.]MDU3420260.1 hypothetical protein [Streptococcus sp.]
MVISKDSKFKKADLNIDFADVDFKTIDPKCMTEYHLEAVDEEIIKKFKSFINNINSSDSFFTYYRGTRLEHIYPDVSYILKNELNKLFIVGEKGVNFIENQLGDSQNQILSEQFNDEEYLLNEIKTKINIDDIFLPSDKNLKLRLLQAIVHNCGKETFPYFKSYMSQYVSTTVGTGNYNIAKNFIDNKGFIIFGFEKISKYFVNSKELQLLLSQSEEHQFIIDVEQEIMIENVLWPSNIFGLFYIHNEKRMFIINPWLVIKLQQIATIGGVAKDSFDSFIYVDQRDFDSLYKELGYGEYIFRPY